jgi:hypothetical protein
MKSEQERHGDGAPDGAPESGPHAARGADHPARHDLHRFMRGELSRPEAMAVVSHLLKGCPVCVAETRRLWSLGERPLCPLPEPDPLPAPAREVGLWL